MSNISEPQSAVSFAPYKSLRVWPAVLLVAGTLATRFVTAIAPDGPSELWMVVAFGPLLCSLLILVWWMTFSRARWIERVTGLMAVLATFVVAMSLSDASMIGPAASVYTIPLGVGAFAICLIFTGRWLTAKRTWLAIFLSALAFMTSTLYKSDGLWGSFAVGLQWRWSESAEDRIAKREAAPIGPESYSKEELRAFSQDPLWPTLRGPNHDGVVKGVVINKDWKSNPPQLRWKITTGPAWSSIVVAGELLFTQEQRGEFECVVCYDAKTGREIWIQKTASRFFESLGGLGPRATPTLSGDSIFTLGAEGIVQRLNAVDGSVVWQQDLRKIANRTPPMWGFSSTPCVMDDLVVLYAGTAEKGLVALDRETGAERWAVGCGGESYASAQPIELNGKTFLSILSSEGLHLYEPKDGQRVFDYEWKHNGYRALQIQLVGNDSLLIPTGLGSGTRLIRITEDNGKMEATEVWTSRKMKPDFNDFVQHAGYLYGFDDNIFGCIDLKSGEKAWRSGRYGKGQVLLVADSNALIVQAETGEVVLLDASPDGQKELGRIEAMSGKSWNHPVLVGNRLFARTADEMICSELQ